MDNLLTLTPVKHFLSLFVKGDQSRLNGLKSSVLFICNRSSSCSDLLEARTLNVGIFHLPFNGAFIVFKATSSEVLKSAYFDLNQVEK